jgi:thioesterase domain-containing protein
LAALFESPTVEQLASLLERQTSNTPASKVLVPIQPRGTAPPFFCVHPVGGSVLCYAELARALGDDQPFWGLEAPGVEMADTIEQLATHYVDAICQFMPHGPYHLGGWSMGGAVAFEMARQLRARGEEVALLALIDVIEPPFKSPDRARARVDHAAMLAWFARDLSAVSGRPVELDASALRVLSEDAAMSRVLAALRAADVVGADVSDARLLSLFEVFARNLRALLAYTAKTYDGSAWFCRGTRDGASSLQNARAWLELAQTGELIEIDADHYSLLSAKLPELACALQKAVAAARGRR